MDIIGIFKNNMMRQDSRIIKHREINTTLEKRIIQKIALQNEVNFRFTEHNKRIYELLFQYFTGSQEFEKQKIPGSDLLGSLNKGILIFGQVGCGKSFALKDVFKPYTSQYLNVNSFQVFEYSRIKYEYETNGANILNQFGDLRSSFGGIRRNDTKTVLIDDWNGSTANHYKSQIEFADELINIRYEAYKRSRKLTHFTTNLYPKKLSEILDYRSISRLREMCNFIVLEDKDWRVK